MTRDSRRDEEAMVVQGDGKGCGARRIFRRIDFYSSKPLVPRHFEFLYILLTNSTRLASYFRVLVIDLHPILHKSSLGLGGVVVYIVCCNTMVKLA
jgi:hypothetical protein